MKEFQFKKVLALILILVLFVSMSACNAKPDESSQVSESNESSSSEVNEPKDPFGKYETPIEVTSVKWTLADFTYPEGDTIENNPYTREYADQLGVNVKYLWITDQTQYKTKLYTSIATGDIPDYFYCDADVFKNLSDNGLIADLTSVYDEYASDRLKEINSSFEEGFNSAVNNGKLEALPLLGFGTISLPVITWVRQDWMEKAGLSFPDTMDGLYDMAEIFMEQNPGSYGFAIEKGLIGGFLTTLGFANSYHSYPGMWLRGDDNNIVYGSTQPETKTFLGKMNELYNKGLIDQEFSVKDVNKVNEDIVAGKVGIVFGPTWLSYWPLNDSIKADETALWKPYPVPSSDDKEVKYQGGWPVNGYFVVNKNAKNPEAIIKMMNLFTKWEDEVKFPAADYNNMNWQSSPIYSNNPMRDYDNHVDLASAVDKGDPSGLTDGQKASYDVMMTWKENRNPDAYGPYYQLSSEGSYSVIKEIVDNNNVLLTELRGPMPSEYSEMKATLDKLEVDTFTKIIMGTSSIDAFDKFVTDWENLGGKTATEAINELYK